MKKLLARLVAVAVLVLPAPALADDVKWEGEVFTTTVGRLTQSKNTSASGQGLFGMALTRIRAGAQASFLDIASAKARFEVPGGLAINSTSFTLDKAWTALPLAIEQAWVGWDSRLGSWKAGMQDALWAVPVEDVWMPWRFVLDAFAVEGGFEPAASLVGLSWGGALGPAHLGAAVQTNEASHSFPALQGTFRYDFSDAVHAGVMVRRSHVNDAWSYFGFQRYLPSASATSSTASPTASDSMRPSTVFSAGAGGGDVTAVLLGIKVKTAPVEFGAELGYKNLAGAVVNSLVVQTGGAATAPPSSSSGSGSSGSGSSGSGSAPLTTTTATSSLYAEGYGASIHVAFPNALSTITPFARVDYGADHAASQSYTVAISTVGALMEVAPNVTVALAVKDIRGFGPSATSKGLVEVDTAITF